MPSQHITPSGGLAPAATGPEIDVRRLPMSFRVSAGGGFSGTVKLQHSPGGGIWVDLQDLENGDDFSIDYQVRKLRAVGTHTGVNAVVIATY